MQARHSTSTDGIADEKLELLAYLLEEEQDIELPKAQTISPREAAGPPPLSFAQQRLWFIEQLDPGNTAYNVPVAYWLSGALDVAALAQSLNEIVRRHEALRTTFATANGQAVQIIAPQLEVTLPLVDLGGFAGQERKAWARRLATREARRPFDLARSPLLRLVLWRLDPETHLLLLTMHHIVFDDWATGVLIQELATLYTAFATDRPTPRAGHQRPPLPELSIQYADFATWQRQWLRGEVLETQLAYWKQRLGGSLPALELPSDRSRPPIQSFRGAIQPFALPQSLAEGLKTYSQRQELTLFMTLLAAFKTLLYRWTGQDDIIVGSPIANRRRLELEGLIGFFTNTLVLRTDLSGNPPFRELSVRVRDGMLGAHDHQDLPFERLVEELQPQRDPSRSPLFQVMFVLRNVSVETLGPAGPRLEPLWVDSGTAKFDLTLFVEDGGEALQGVIEYNTDLFDAATINRMAGHFQTLLQGIVANPDQRIAQLPLLPPAERRQVLYNWNETGRDYPSHCVHELFEAQVARSPGHVALQFGAQRLTYEALNRRANQLAHHLRSLGVGPDVRVGVCLHRSLEMMVGVLAVLKAGGAYVPLDPTYPAERLRFMLQDTQTPVLLTQQALAADLPPTQAQVLCLDADWDAVVRGQPATNPASGVAPDNPAYVIYTSGSTGWPKGVMLPHRALSNLLYWQLEHTTLPQAPKTLQFASLSFDVSFQETFATWAAGGTLLLVTDALRRDATALLQLIVEQEVQRFFLPFVAMQALAEAVASGAPPPSALREMVTAGEQLQTTPPIVRLFEQLPDCVLHNHYGPSESHVVTAFTLPESPASWPALPPIGRPIANTRIYLLDPQLNPVPVGVPGELYIGGVSLARGYMNRPGLTAERFLPAPAFASPPLAEGIEGETGARVYRTGDLARYLANGDIEFLGRADLQLKVRGYRVELGEIQIVLSQHPAVRETVVGVREDAPGPKQLVAYVVPEQAGSPPTTSHLRRFLLKRLPDYMIPSVFVFLDVWPLTPSGKIDRRALPAPDQVRPELEDTFVAPRTPIEEVIAAIWAGVLRLDHVGVHDNFFELGGHSLLATQVIARLREAFQVEVPVRSLFEAPTIAGLGATVEALRAQELAPSAPPITPVDRDGGLPLSFSQQRLWFLDQLQGLDAAYNLPTPMHLTGQLDVPALAQSFNAIIRRHEVLRTTFALVNDQPAQIIAPPLARPLPVVDLQALAQVKREAQARRLVAEEAFRPFDLARGPLLRAALLRLGEKDYILLLTMHHIISDGWSMDVFVREMTALYATFSAGRRQPPLTTLPIQYADFAAWQRRWLQEETLQKQLVYWRQRLGDAPAVLELPTDRSRPPVQTHRGAIQTFALDQDLVAALKALSRQEGVTLFMSLLAAFKALLYRYTGQRDVSVGTPIANRNRTEIEGLIGFFVNTLVMRTDLSGNPSFRELLSRVREVAVGAYVHQDLPFEKLVEELQPERSLSHTPFFQVMFNHLNTPRSAWDLPGLSVEYLPLEYLGAGRSVAKFDLNLAVKEAGEGLQGTLVYNTDLFDPPTIQRLEGHFQTLLAGAVADPGRRLLELPLLTPGEQRQLLVEWTATQTTYPEVQCVHQLFEQQAARTPDQVAVLFEGGQYTYRELNQRANQVAHHLQRLGVGPDVRVGLLMQRSLDILVGLIGILKAGGAYVPLDPIYPPQRVRFMLQDVQVSALVTQSDLAAELGDLGAVPVVCLDSDWGAIAQHSVANPPLRVVPSNLMYVLFTSGSTGRPKGVAVEHRNYLNYYHGVMPRLKLAPGMRFALVSTFSTDLGTIQFWAPLTTGGAVHVFSYERATDPEAMAAYFRQHAIDVLKLVPSHYEALQGAPGAEEVVPRHLVIFTGEPSRWETVAQVKALNPGCMVQDHYGVTETTCATAVYRTPDEIPAQPAATLPLGQLLGNVRVYTLDARMEPTPIGVPGELCIAGYGVTRGYVGRPALTAERFTPDPFSCEGGARLYRTGDLAYYRRDGIVKLLGRMDYQVKIRGYRIETGEIESLLGESSTVQDAVVVAREDVVGDTRLVAYVVPRPGQDGNFSTSPLRDHLRRHLPDYMVPSAFVTLERMPLNPNGKIDRFALPEPEYSRLEAGSDFVAPRNELEGRIAASWSEVLGVEKIGIDDNFFDLGGESFKAIRAVRKLGDSVSILDLFKHPTIRGLAGYLAGEGPKSDGLLHELTPPVAARDRLVSLVCVPYGGGSAVVFQPLANALPKNCSLYAVQLPGHDYARQDQALQPLEEVARRCADEIKRDVSGPLALYGHCVGGALATEIARLLEEAGVKVVGVFIAGAFPTPRLPGKFFEWLNRILPSDRWFSNRTLYEGLRALGGFTDVIDPQEREFVMQSLRHDANQAEDYFTAAYATAKRQRLKAPILCIVGQMDRATEFYEERFQEWRLFSDVVDLAVIPRAGHYFLKHQASQVAKVVTGQLATWQERTPREPSPVAKSPSVAASEARVVPKRTVAPSLRLFFLVAFGQMISLVGTGLTTFALGVWVYQKTGAVSDLAIISVFAMLPGILILPVAGAIVDRQDRRLIMILGDAAAACGTLVLAGLLWSDALQIWHIYVTASIGAIANAFQRPAYLAAITQLVPKQYLGHANGIAQLGTAVGNLLAPFLGGVLVVMVGLSGVVLIDFVTFVFAIATLLFIRFPDTLFRKREEPLLQEIIGGWNYVIKRHSLVALVVFFVVSNFMFSVMIVLTTPLVLSFGSSAVLGTVVAINGTGLLLGGLAMSLWGGTQRRTQGVIGFVASLGLSLIVAGLRPSPISVAIGVFGVGVSISFINAHWLALIQSKVGLELQGRVLSTIQMLEWSMIPIGFVLTGPLADKVFEPLMAHGGPLAGSVGRLIGAGPGRGMALMVILVGVLQVMWAALSYRYRPLRFMEDMLPDAIPDAVIVADKDELQKQADRQLLAEAA